MMCSSAILCVNHLARVAVVHADGVCDTRAPQSVGRQGGATLGQGARHQVARPHIVHG